MAGMRVHELAKEYGITSAELLERLAEMKIPAKNYSSTLQPAYLNRVRKVLDKEYAERSAEVKAEQAAEEAERKRLEDEKAAAEAAERKRIADAERARRAKAKAEREAELGEVSQVKAAPVPQVEQSVEEKAPVISEPEVAPVIEAEPTLELAPVELVEDELHDDAPVALEAQEEVAEADASAEETPQEEALHEAQEEVDELHTESASETASPLDSLRAQIDAEAARLKAEKTKKAESAKDAKPGKRHGNANKGREQDGKHAAKSGEKRKKGQHSNQYGDLLENPEFNSLFETQQAPGVSDDTPVIPDDDDRYRRMAQQAAKLQRDRVLEEARAAVDAAESESGGRRKKKKERREEQKAERKAQERAAKEAQGIVVDDESILKVSTGVSAGELADLLGVPANDIIKRLFLLGTPLTVNQPMTDDLVELIADDLGRKIKVMTPEEEMHFEFVDKDEDLKPRPPVVTVMGHVDHGKTSLLDAIRSTGVVQTEAGGITQHIGASVTKLDDGRTITFIDTPGHEAFTTMRARGAAVTDVVVLVVAADDGVMPQTIEAIHHAEAAGVPIVVAVNKIDKPGADPTRVRSELSEHGIIPEEWGGQNMFVEVSAKKRLNIEDLLETILLQADVLELKANPDTFASGFVIESNLDRGRGAVATVLVQRGTLRVGDAIVAGMTYGRVRALITPKGDHTQEAYPAQPVEIMGLNGIPNAGDEFRVFEEERDARNLAEERALKARLMAEKKKSHVSLDDLFARIEEGNMSELNLVVKADVQGSIEALEGALEKMDQSEVRINVIHSAVGGITETDVTLAAASDAIIIGFGVRPESKAKAAAEREKVDIRTYRIIYQAIDDINAARVGLLAPEEIEVDTAMAEIRELFKVPKVGTIAGCIVHEGEINRSDKVRVVRNGTVIYEGELASLRRFKDDVNSVHAGLECGLSIVGFNDIKEGDTIETYRIDKVARKE